MFHVDRVNESDLAELALLYTELAGEPVDHEAMIPVFRKLDQNPDYILLAARTGEGRLAGSVMGVVCLDLCFGERPFMIMENMVVGERFHGMGAGRVLIQSLETAARERRCVFIQFCSSWFREGAHRFYEACGYDPGMVKGYRKFLD
jgi:GNAT superfamily N-acetyltransferase